MPPDAGIVWDDTPAVDGVVWDKAPAEVPTIEQRVLSSAPGRFLRGAGLSGMGLVQDIAHGTAYLESKVPPALRKYLQSDAQATSDQLDRDMARGETKQQQAQTASGFSGPDIAGLAGAIASPTNFVLPELAGPRMVAGVMQKAPLALRLASGTAKGAAMGGMQPVLDQSTPYAEQKKQQIGYGALGGVAAPVIGATVSRALSPALSPAVRFLLDKGVRLTPGQMLGEGAKAVEDKLSSFFIGGGFIKKAQQRSIDDFNRATADDALGEIGQKLPRNVDVGHDLVQHVEGHIGDVYDTTLPKMTGTLDTPLMQDFDKIITTARAEGAKSDVLQSITNIIKGQFADRSTAAGGAPFDGNTLKAIQSDLTRIASNHASSPTADDGVIAHAVADAHAAFGRMLERQNPNEAGRLREANAAWAKYARIRRAASAVGADKGRFTPAQFSNAVRASDKTAGKGAHAKGEALMQDLSDAGKSVLPQKYPDSGTAGRLALLAALAGGSAVPGLSVPAAVAGTGLGALYTRPGTALARGLIGHQDYPRLSDFAVRGGNLAAGPLGALAVGVPQAQPLIEGGE